MRWQQRGCGGAKLHGDLFQRFMAWTVAEMDTFLTEVRNTDH